MLKQTVKIADGVAGGASFLHCSEALKETTESCGYVVRKID